MTLFRRGEEKTLIRARVPTHIAQRVQLLLTDPMRGKPGYGQMSILITELLTNWLAARKAGAAKRNKPPEGLSDE